MSEEGVFGENGTYYPFDDSLALELEYKWLHKPTNRQGKRESRFVSRSAFLSTLKKWNDSNSDWICYP